MRHMLQEEVHHFRIDDWSSQPGKACWGKGLEEGVSISKGRERERASSKNKC